MTVERSRINSKINQRAQAVPDGRRNTSPSVRIPLVLKALQDRHLPHRIIQAQSDESTALATWTERAFPFISSQIDWSKVHVHECVEWSGLNDAVSKFLRLVGSMDTDSLVLITWADLLCPGLEIQLKDAVQIAREIFEEHETSTDVYVFSRSHKWLIEMHHEGTLCFGRSDL